MAEEDALYAKSQNGTPVTNYVEKVTALLNEHEEARSALEAQLAEWEALHAAEIAALKQAVSDAEEQIDREKEIREERLSLAKEVYQTKVSDNRKKINKINEVIY